MFQSRIIRFMILIALIVSLCIIMEKNSYAEEECLGNICFAWAFGAYVSSENERKLVKIERDRELKTGDQLKMLLMLKRKCYLYVFYYSAQGQLFMLFPYSLD